MFTTQDLDLIKRKGMSLATIEENLKRFETGFPYRHYW